MRFRLYSSCYLLLAVVFLLPTVQSRTGSSRGAATGALRLGGPIACVGNETFACDDGRCIPGSWRCDGDVDCRGEEDEKDCKIVQCGKDEFRCGENGGPQYKVNQNPCIPLKWKCDGEYDCEDRSDEKNCGDVNCTSEQFACSEFDGQYKLCIPNTWKCDGQKDCTSGADELNCTSTKVCAETDFRCRNDVCIFNSWKCDGENDCGDGSDEEDCKASSTELCEQKLMYQCKNKDGCIPREWLCDGESDCLDHSDEQNCTARGHACKHPEFEFACATGTRCINKMWVCDGEVDCPDASDEKSCTDDRDCLKDEFTCESNKRCISMAMKCDGRDDCTDGSDEEGCPKEVDCDAEREYKCPQTPTQCIKWQNLCKEKSHICGSDGDECTKQIHKCGNNTDGCKCQNSYIKGKNASVCYCMEGYKLEDGKCMDINECLIPGTCDHKCTNTAGSFECTCHHGYKLSYNKNSEHPTKCRAMGGDPLVLLSNRATIRQFDLITNVHAPLIQSPGSAVAMDFHKEQENIIWSDIAKQKIFICNIGKDNINHHLAIRNGSECTGNSSVLVGDTIQTPDGLAVDWIHDLLFWTDGGLDQINVMDLKTKKRRVLFHDDLEEPRAIAVDPEMGLIFWTDWGKEARIERSGMDGQARTVIVAGETVKWPNGLALDLIDKRVYWADAKLKSIFSCDYWGKQIQIIRGMSIMIPPFEFALSRFLGARRAVQQSRIQPSEIADSTVLHSHQHLRHPFSLAVFEDRIYYTDWETDGVVTVNKFDGSDLRNLMQKVTTPMTVRIYHSQAQPQHENKCHKNQCEQICLPRGIFVKESAGLETKWLGHPYTCVCEGKTPADVVKCAVEIATEGASSGFSFSTMLFLLMLVIFGTVGFMYYRRRSNGPGNFSALNFDNPIYRRTVEHEMDDPFRDPFTEQEGVSINGGLNRDAEMDLQNPTVNS